MSLKVAELAGAAESQMNCMEVWGGNQPTENYLPRPGLDLWVWGRSRSVAAAGGSDLHLISSCASGRITRMLLADICGCGSLFSELAGDLRNLMKRNVNVIKQSRFVRDMSDELESASERGGFASTLISTYFAPTRSLALCNAGHPPPLLYRSGQRAWSVLRQTGTVTEHPDTAPGVVSKDEYQQFKTKLECGDMVLSYSNSLTECRDEGGRTLGVGGILNRVRQLDASQPRELATTLATRIQNEHADNLATEDATVLLCRANDRAVTWRENILAPLRLLLLREVSDATKFR